MEKSSRSTGSLVRNLRCEQTFRRCIPEQIRPGMRDKKNPGVSLETVDFKGHLAFSKWHQRLVAGLISAWTVWA
jgi:hypothetical protein